MHNVAKMKIGRCAYGVMLGEDDYPAQESVLAALSDAAGDVLVRSGDGGVLRHPVGRSSSGHFRDGHRRAPETGEPTHTRSERGRLTDQGLELIRECFERDEVEANDQRFLFLPRPERPPM